MNVHDWIGIVEAALILVLGVAFIFWHRKMSKAPVYPRSSGNYTDIGPECFTDGDVISYKGENFYRACDAWVRDNPGGGASYCVKRVGHPGHLHESYDGSIRVEEHAY